MKALNPLVSIIVPIYNVADYLPATLESIKTQTYQNLEVILVDDGSTDSSAAICDQACDQDPRFRVVHRLNSGVSASRNYALDQVSGDYCMFIDSDDLVKENYVESMVDIALKTNSPLVTCDFMDGRHHSRDEFSALCPPLNPDFHEILIQDYRYTNGYAHDTVWGGLFHTSLIGDLRFDLDLFVGEDSLFFSRFLLRARKEVYVNAQYYYYTFRNNSLAHAEYSKQRYTEVLAWERICAEASGEDDVFVNECYVALAIRCRKNYERAVKYHYPDHVLRAALLRRCFTLCRYVYRSKERTAMEKVKYTLFLCAPTLFTKLKIKAKSDSIF